MPNPKITRFVGLFSSLFKDSAGLKCQLSPASARLLWIMGGLGDAPQLTSCSLPSDEHISTLLDLRGDVSKEVRHLVLEMMAQHPQALPESYQPIFSTILVPAPELPFCLRKGKCA